jgi:ABC-type multidrug transport system ATPase subunit
VSLDAPLPEALRVDEVCALAAAVRGEAERPAAERLEPIGAGALASQRVRSLSVGERRAVSLGIALTSKAEVILVDEPLMLDSVSPRLVMDALRGRAASAAVIVTTASARDALRLGDSLGILSNGMYAPLSPELAMTSSEGAATVRVVVPARGNATALVGALAGADGVIRVESSTYEDGAILLLVTGNDLVRLSRTITHAIATSRVDVDLIEPATLAHDAIATALAERAAPAPPPPPAAPPSAPPPPPTAPTEAQ